MNASGTPLPRSLAHVGYVVPDMQKALAQWQAAGATVEIPPTSDPIQGVVCASSLIHLDKTRPSTKCLAWSGPFGM